MSISCATALRTSVSCSAEAPAPRPEIPKSFCPSSVRVKRASCICLQYASVLYGSLMPCWVHRLLSVVGRGPCRQARLKNARASVFVNFRCAGYPMEFPTYVRVLYSTLRVAHAETETKRHCQIPKPETCGHSSAEFPKAGFHDKSQLEVWTLSFSSSQATPRFLSQPTTDATSYGHASLAIRSTPRPKCH